MVVAAEAVEAGGEVEEAVEVGGFGGGVGGEVLESAAQGDGERGGEEGGGGGGVARVILEGGGLLAEVGEPGAGLLELEPVGEAAAAPFGEVLFSDGAAVEVGGEDGLDLGEGIEPGEEGGGGLAVVEAGIELVADGGGEAGDFAGARRGGEGVAARLRQGCGG